MKFVLKSTGEEVDVPDDPQEQALARAAGLVPADVVEAGKGTTLQAGAEAAQRLVGGAAEGIQNATGFGTAPGLDEIDDQGHKLPGGGIGSLQEAYSPEARLRREAHPLAAGIGTGLAAAPAAALAGAGAALALPGAAIPLLGGSAAGLAAESAAQAIPQEYDDAWFEQRPFELSGVAAKTLMFAGGDLLFRGAFQGGKRLLFGASSEAAGLGRNIVSEAQGAARELAPEFAPAGGGGSVGAASAADLSEPFDDALRTMSDKDAMVLARDSVDHLHLAAQNSSEAFTRVNQGISDSLGSQLKYEDFAANAQDWDAPLLERQAKWLDGMVEQGDELARSLGAFAEGDKAAPDLGNLGKKAVSLIDSFNRRIAQETDPARRNLLTDAYKKQFDSLTMGIDASFGVDSVTRTDLKAAIAPLREGLRKGLENPKYWGENAVIQKSLNGPWHTFLEDWPAVQRQVLEATGHVQFDQMGAGRISKESTVDRMLALLGKDPRSNQEFGKHLSGAFDGLQGLIEARQAHGIAGTEGLEAMAGDVRNLMEDWNLAQTVGVAKNRVANMQRDPRKWAKLALDFAERAPVIGKPIQAGRHLVGALSNDLHLDPNTAVGSVWERAYQRYAKNPAMQDPSVARNYADWVIDALNQRGGMAPKPPPGAVGAPAAPMANDVMTGTPGFRQAAQPSVEGSLFAGASGAGDVLAKVPEGLRGRVRAGGVRSVEQARELLAGDQLPSGALDVGGALRVSGAGEGGRVPKRVVGSGAGVQTPGGQPQGGAGSVQLAPDIFTPHVGSVSHGGLLAERLSGPLGKTPGGFFRGADGVIRYIKADKDAAHSAIEAGNAAMYKALGRQVPDLQVVRLPGGHSALASESFGPEWKELHDVPDWSALPKSVRDSYAEGVPTDFIMGNWDVSRNSKNIMTDGKTTLMVDPGEAATNAWAAKWFSGNERQGAQEIGRTIAYGHGEGAIPGSVGTPSHELLRGYAASEGELRALMGRSFDRSVSAIEQAGGPEAFIRQHQPTLGDAEVKRAAAEMTDRLSKFKAALPFFAGAVYMAFGGTAEAAERPPPPAQAPEHAYRDAMREISQAGDQQISQLASSVLRGRGLKPGKKGPLELFAGRRSLEDAVDSARQRLGALGSDPSQLVRELAGSVGDLPRTHPAVYQALVQKAAQISQYLQASLDPPTAVTLMNPRGGKLSFDRAWDYAARHVGATQPRTALREVVRGTAPPEMIAAVQQNWPELWEPFRAELLGQVQRMAAAGRHIPSEKLRRLDSQLGMDGQLDPSASLAVASHMLQAQDAEQAKRQQAGQGGGARSLSSSNTASGYRTTLSAIQSEVSP